MFYKTKKTIAGFLVVLLITPQITNAQFVDVMNTVKEYGLDTLAYMLASTAGTKLSNKIFNKANGGASGDDSQPSFVKGFNSFFEDLDRSKIQKFITDLEVSQNPFAENIAKSMIFAYSTAGGPGVPDDIGGFNIDKMLGPNYQKFYDDASIGGYDGFLAMTIPGNTAIGAQKIAEEKIGRAIEDAREAEKLKLTSPGILPQQEDCKMDFKSYAKQVKDIKANRDKYKDQNSTLTAPDSTVLKDAKAEITRIENDIAGKESSINIKKNNIKNSLEPQLAMLMMGNGGAPTTEASILQARINGEEDLITGLQSEISALKGDLSTTRELQNTVQGTRGLVAAGSQALAEDFGRCLIDAIQNPMGLVSSGLQGATDLAMDKIKDSDEIGELIAGIFLSMANSFLQNGLASLRADYRQAPPMVGGPEQLQSASGGTVNWTQTPVTVVDLRNDLSLAIDYTQQELALIQEYIALIGGKNIDYSNGVHQTSSFPKLVSNLSACIPGPDFDYIDKIDKYVQTQTRPLEAALAKGKGTENKQENREEAKDIIDTAVPLAKAEVEVWMTDLERNIPGAFTLQSQTSKLIDVQKVYGQKRSDLIKRQSAVNVLRKIQNDIKTSLRYVAQSNSGIISTNVIDKIVFTETSWKAAPAADKELLLTWVEGAKKMTRPQYEADQFAFVMNHVWDVWENPEMYLPTNVPVQGQNSVELTNDQLLWQYGEANVSDVQQRRSQILGTAPVSNATLFMELKNQIRTEYNAVGERVSIKRNVDQAELDVSEIKAIMLDINDSLSDCSLLREITFRNQHLTGTNSFVVTNKNAHEQLRQELLRRQNEFKTDAIRNAIQDGSVSILNTDPTEFPRGMIDNEQCVTSQNRNKIINRTEAELDTLGVPSSIKRFLIGRLRTDTCYQFTGLTEIDYTSENRYQIPPAKNIWEIFAQDPGTSSPNRFFLCPFSVNLLLVDEERGTKKNGELRCALSNGSPWYTTKESDIVSYIFKDSISAISAP